MRFCIEGVCVALNRTSRQTEAGALDVGITVPERGDLTVPILFHGDGARYRRNLEGFMYSWGSCMAPGAPWDCKILIAGAPGLLARR